MAIDWLAVAQYLGPKAVEAAKRYVGDRNAAALKESRNEHATAAATEIARMILSGHTTANASLSNLVLEYDGLLQKGAVVPRDLRSAVETLIEKARQAQYSEFRADHRQGGYHYRPRIAAKKAPATRMAAKKSAAKKAPATRMAAKKSAAKKSVARKST